MLVSFAALALTAHPAAGQHVPLRAVAALDQTIGGELRPLVPAPLPIPGRATAPDGAALPHVRNRLEACLTIGKDDPALAVTLARRWLKDAKTPTQQVRPNQCLGVMLAAVGDYAGAQKAFGDAIAGIPPEQMVSGVRLMAMAGNAALGSAHPADALVWFERALAVKDFTDAAALGAIEADRARALVALDRIADAAAALAHARTLAPDNPDVWLLSATLSRRQGDLAAAASQITHAADIAPRDAAVGLEAGVIAVLGHRDEAARAAWHSVIALDPTSDEAGIAKQYLDQLGPPAPPSSAATTAAPAAPPATPPHQG